MFRIRGGRAFPVYVNPPGRDPTATRLSEFGGSRMALSALPGMLAGVEAEIVLASRTLTPVASYTPKRTVAPAVKLNPAMFTEVPPWTGPDEGLTLTISGLDRMYTVRSYLPYSPRGVGV